MNNNAFHRKNLSFVRYSTIFVEEMPPSAKSTLL